MKTRMNALGVRHTPKLFVFVAVSLAGRSAEASFVLHTNYPTWQTQVNGPIIDPHINTHFDPADGPVQPVPGDTFADLGLVMQSSSGLFAHQYPSSQNFYLTTDSPGTSVELLFTTPITAAWVNSTVNNPQMGSDHGYFVQFYNGQALLGQSTIFGSVGAISSEAFDRVVIGAPLASDTVIYSAVRWVQVPSPGSLCFLAGACQFMGRRRRSL